MTNKIDDILKELCRWDASGAFVNHGKIKVAKKALLALFKSCVPKPWKIYPKEEEFGSGWNACVDQITSTIDKEGVK